MPTTTTAFVVSTLSVAVAIAAAICLEFDVCVWHIWLKELVQASRERKRRRRRTAQALA